MNLRFSLPNTTVSKLLGTALPACLGVGLCVGMFASARSSFASPAPLPVPDKESKPLPLIGKPKVYVIPMTGQLGTDIIKDIYQTIIEDVRKVKPDFIVYHMDSADIPKSTMIKDQADREGEAGMFDPGEIRELIKTLHEDMRDLPQIMWVEDAYGPVSMVSLAWPDLYMTNKARLGGLGNLVPRLKKQWTDPDVQAKMIAAWTGIIKGIMEQGGYPYELGDAFLYPERLLSASFEGRKVVFRGDMTGQWLIDDSTEMAVGFRATTAEDVGLSDGNADSFEDLMFILGYREVDKIESGQKLYDDYVRDWRKALATAIENLRDGQNAEGGGDIKDVQKAKQLYEKVISIMKRYPAVEKRIKAQGGPSILALELHIDELKELITGAKKNRNGGGSSGGGGGRSSPGGGPGSR
jgi:uncharacterized membrane protein YgcG